MSRCQDIKGYFDVPMFIGKEACHYQDYPTFVERQHRLLEAFREKLVSHLEMINYSSRHVD